LLLRVFGAVGVVGGVALLGQDIQPGEEAQGLVEVEVADVAVEGLVMDPDPVGLFVVMPLAEVVQDLDRLGVAGRLQRVPAVLLGPRHHLCAPRSGDGG
jgi:hypothetical protein